jgi:hypothetical protein
MAEERGHGTSHNPPGVLLLVLVLVLLLLFGIGILLLSRVPTAITPTNLRSGEGSHY